MTKSASNRTSSYTSVNLGESQMDPFSSQRFHESASVDLDHETSSFCRFQSEQAAVHAANEAQQLQDEIEYFESFDFEDSNLDMDEVDAMNDDAYEALVNVESRLRSFVKRSTVSGEKYASLFNRGTPIASNAVKVKKTRMSNFYSYADVSAESIAAVINVTRPFSGDYATAPKGLGFFLINGTLVPNTFIEQVESQLHSVRLNCFDVITVTELFKPEFLDTLSANELSVLGDAVLVLIEKGVIALDLTVNVKGAA